MKILFSFLLLCLISAPTFVRAQSQRPSNQEKSAKASFAKGRVIVKFKNSSSINTYDITRKFRARAARRLQANGDVRSSRVQRRDRRTMAQNTTNLTNLYVLETEDPDADIDALIKSYKNDPNVEYAQPDYEMKASYLPNDPYYNSSNSWGQGFADMWALKKIQPQEAWDITKGSGVIVAVVDTGVDTNHPDMAANIWTNPGEVIDGADNDGNGYIDDVQGYNFYYGYYNPYDDNGHGTHVAGIIAAAANNIGVVGVAPEAKIMALKVLNNNGSGSTSQLASAIIYAAQNGADVINNSWGCADGCPSNPLIEDAVRYAHGLGAVVVFAAGNAQMDSSVMSPQNMVNPKPIVVGASNEDDVLAGFSNLGYMVDLVAPGTSVLSLKAQGCNGAMICPNDLVVNQNYLRQQGTSMATPFVSGVAALIRAIHPEFSPDDVRNALRASADDVGAAGTDGRTGAGRLNALRALQVVSVPQLKITSPGIFPQPTPGTIAIIGTAGGSGFTSYQLFHGVGTQPTTWTAVTPVTSTPVQNGTLGQVTISAAGASTIKLVVQANGRSYDTYTQVFVEGTSTVIKTDGAGDVYFTLRGLPELADGRAVWSMTNGSPTRANIYYYDFATNTGRYIANQFYGTMTPNDPDVSGNKVVWADLYYSQNFSSLIYVYDVSTNQGEYIAVNGLNSHPKISGNRIVWQSERNGNTDIYMYDLSTRLETRITTNSAIQMMPEIDGNKIVWFDGRNGGNSLWEVYMFDLTTMTERRVSETLFQLNSLGSGSYWNRLSINGNRIVWDKNENANQFIVLYDLNLEWQRDLPVPENEQIHVRRLPKIYGDRVVYTIRDDRGKNQTAVYDLLNDRETIHTASISGVSASTIEGTKLVWRAMHNETVGAFKSMELPPLPSPAPTPAPTFTTTTTSVAPGGIMLVTWNNMNPNYHRDWIGLVPAGGSWTAGSFRVYAISASPNLPPGPLRPGANSAISFALPTTIASGQYQLVYYSNDTMVERARTTSFRIGPIDSIKVAQSSVVSGQSISISWEGMSQLSRYDWIALAPVGQPWGGGANPWVYTTGSKDAPPSGFVAPADGTTSLVVPGNYLAGYYQVVYYANNGWQELARSPAFAVAAPPRVLTVTHPTNYAGQSISFSWSNMTPTARYDWIGIAPVGQPWGGGANPWVYTTGSKNAPPSGFVAPANGTTTLPLPIDFAPGQYQLVYYADNGWQELARSSTFAVAPPKLVTLTQSSVVAGQSILFSWSGITPTARFDWVGIAPAGQPWGGGANPWVYTTGSKNAPPIDFVPLGSGNSSLAIPAGYPPGQYQLVYYSNNSWEEIARSVTFTVVP